MFTNSLTRFVVSFCHPRPSIESRTSPTLFLSSPTPIGDPGFGGGVIWKDAGRHVPCRLMVSVCRGGPGCPPFLSFLLRGFGPARRGPFVSAKEPKTIGARAWPPRGGACAPVPGVWAAELAALRQSSPPNGRDGTGAQPRPEAPGGGICLFCHPRLDRASSLLSSPTLLLSSPPPPLVIPDSDRGSSVVASRTKKNQRHWILDDK